MFRTFGAELNDCVHPRQVDWTVGNIRPTTVGQRKRLLHCYECTVFCSQGCSLLPRIILTIGAGSCSLILRICGGVHFL